MTNHTKYPEFMPAASQISRLAALGLSVDDFEVEVLAEPDDVEPEDSHSDPDDAADVRARMEVYGVWAWCSVEVIVYLISNPQVRGNDYLGGCSYDDRRDFIEHSMYFGDMCSTALETALNQLEAEAAAAR